MCVNLYICIHACVHIYLYNSPRGANGDDSMWLTNNDGAKKRER